MFFFLPLGGSRIQRHQKKGNWRKIKYRWSCHDIGLGEEDGKEVYFCKHEFLGLLKGDHCSFRNIIWLMASHRGASSLSQTYQNKTYVLTMYICLCVGVCTWVWVPVEAGRCWIPWSWCYRGLWATHHGCWELTRVLLKGREYSSPAEHPSCLHPTSPRLETQRCAELQWHTA